VEIMGSKLLFLAVALSLAPAMAERNVREFGARGDGATDDTKSIQAALDAAAPKGELVKLPEGIYAVKGVLAIPEGVTLEGAWRGPHTSQLDKGTTLYAYAGRDAASSAPFISLKTGSTIKGVTIFYPEQKVGDIHPYPWTIQGQGQHYNAIDVTIANAYDGVDCGTFHNEGHHLRNVLLCAVHRGVLIDRCSDIGRVENVHIHNVYWWRVSPPYRLTGDQVKALEAYTKENLIGFTIGRTDWEYISNSFVIWAKIGFHFRRVAEKTGNVLVTQSGSDLGPVAVKIDELQAHAGVAFENCQFMSGFEIGPQNQGPVKLANCGFWGRAGAGSQMVLDGEGTVTLTATHFHQWDQAREGKPCIEARNGSLILQGCDFMGPGNASPHIHLGQGVKSAALIGNRFQGGAIRIVNESAGDVQMVGNLKQ
jgi:hypothetical protein